LVELWLAKTGCSSYVVSTAVDGDTPVRSDCAEYRPLARPF
jgi:hypothetical protein